MKRILPILILFCFLSAEGYAQRALIDSAYYITSDSSGDLITATKDIYTRSSDNLIDEVREYLLDKEEGTYYGGSRSRYTYDESGRRTSEAWWNGVSGNFDYKDSRSHKIFEYTDFGELAKSYAMKNFKGERIQGGSSNYYYTETKLDSTVVMIHDESTGSYKLNYKMTYTYYEDYYEELMQHFNYFTNNIEDNYKVKYYEKDGKLIKKQKSVFNNNSWSESKHHTEYEYTPNGYIEIEYESGEPDSKQEYIYDEHGQQVSHKSFFGYKQEGYWLLNTHWQTTIFYSEHLTNNPKITPNNIRIYSLKNSNSITIDSDISTTLSIYSLSGRLLAHKSINIGLNDIPINRGVYLIKCASISKKILVQ